MNLNIEKKALRFTITAMKLTLLVLITCTCNGLKLTLGPLNLENQIGYSTFFGKPARRIVDVTEYAISKTDGLGLASWHRTKLLTKLQYQATQDLEFYQKLGLMPKKCLQIKLFQYQPIILSSSSPFKTVWIAPKQSLLTECPPPN